MAKSFAEMTDEELSLEACHHAPSARLNGRILTAEERQDLIQRIVDNEDAEHRDRMRQKFGRY